MALGAKQQQMARTPFHAHHLALGAKMVPFAGFEMPIQYPTGITAEHKAVRERCGMFDVSHMGEFVVRGPGAADFLNYVTTNDVQALEIGQAQYSTLLNDRGTIEDDCLVYRFADRLMVVVNASNREKDYTHIDRERHRFDCTIEDVSDETALLAVQGPEAQRILQPLVDADLESIEYYRFLEGRVGGAPAVISRTGYTGEDGFELYFGANDGDRVWSAIMATGEVTPCGLGARDTLRLEMGMALYGNDIDDTVNPYEANLAWLVKLKKGDFVGRDALVRQKERGISRKLIGFVLESRAFPRPGFPVFQAGVAQGLTRSGTVSPSLGTPIGTCYLPPDGAAAGSGLEVEIRGKRIPGRVVKLPFYTRASHR
jgi:aminomethyltransferase